jgi:hypothetical protein
MIECHSQIERTRPELSTLLETFGAELKADHSTKLEEIRRDLDK